MLASCNRLFPQGGNNGLKVQSLDAGVLERIINLWRPKGSAGQDFFIVPEYHMNERIEGDIHGIDDALLVGPGIAHGTISAAVNILPNFKQYQLAQREGFTLRFGRGGVVQEIYAGLTAAAAFG
jgi:hypothetical protein